MAYSDEELKEISRDPVRLRAYFWHVAMNAKRIAQQNRRTSHQLALSHPVTNYKPVFEEGRELWDRARHMDRFSEAVLANIDLLVKSSLERDECERPTEAPGVR